MSTVKAAVMEIARQLPEECSWDEVMYRIYVRQKIEKGIQDADEDRVVTHEEVFEEFRDGTHPMD